MVGSPLRATTSARRLDAAYAPALLPPRADDAPNAAKRRSRRAVVLRALVIADLIGFALSFLIAEVVVNSTPGLKFAVLVATLPGWLVGAKLLKLYQDDQARIDHSTVDDLSRVFLLVSAGGFALTRLAHIHSSAVERDTTAMTVLWATAIVLVTASRTLARVYVRRRASFRQNALIVGAGDVGQALAHKLLLHPEYRVNVVGFVDDEPRQRRDDLLELAIVASTEDLAAAVRAYDVERVFVAFSREPLERTLEHMRTLSHLPVCVEIVPRLFQSVGPKARIDWLEAIPLVALDPRSGSSTSRVVKRGIDIVGALVGLVLTAPLFALIAWRIRRDSPGPVIFRQRRLGRGMEPFTVLKFRTMTVDDGHDEAHRRAIKEAMKPGATHRSNGLFKAANEARLTSIGRLLRRTSLDELPQLVNVLRGDMSLVGPRPSLPYEIEEFAPHHFERFAVRPGLTGLWQVTGRALTSWREAVEMDVAYVRTWSLALDLRLLCLTPAQLVRLKTC